MSDPIKTVHAGYAGLATPVAAVAVGRNGSSGGPSAGPNLSDTP